MLSKYVTKRLQQLSTTQQPQTALFYARLWHSLAPSTDSDHESLHALALAFLQAGEPYSAIFLVRDSTGLDKLDLDADFVIEDTEKPCYGCAFVVAKCCQHLGRYSEGQSVLARAVKRCTPTNIIIPSPTSTPASAFLLLANLSYKSKASEAAIENYKKALEEDPWLWEAFTGLCDIGAPPAADSFFSNPPALSRSNTSRSSRPPLSPNLHRQKSPVESVVGVLRQAEESNSGGLFTPDVANQGNGERKLGLMGPSSWDNSSTMGDSTFALTGDQSSKRHFPTFMSQATSFLPSSLRGSAASPTNNNGSPPKSLNMKRPRGKDLLKRPVETPQSQISNSMPLPLARELRPNGVASGRDKYEEDMSSIRRSSRLKTTSKPAPAQKGPTHRSSRSRSAASSTSTDLPSPPPPPPSNFPQSQEMVDAIHQKLADDYLRDILRKCARVYRSLSVYQCQQAIKEVDMLPDELKTSAWAMDILARAFYEIANYAMARRAFTFLQHLEPYRLQSMEQHSTLLWHLSDLPTLSHLSQTLISISRTSPQAWIAVGNSLSLQRDHDEAMRCFRRATQVDPGCAYAWTLCGYEAVEMEEYERALAFYRTAIRTDARHYNAWYGMGLVYLKTDKPRYAEHHFKRAIEINPTNPVLLCCIGMALEKSDDIVQAIHFYERASKYAPQSPMVQFKRIRALVALQRYDEAILSLEPLARQAPDEANIFFLLGKCYLKKDKRREATVAFTNARELAPKLESAINAVLLANGDDVDEEE
ncbi:uncharacterized protein L203_103577 [Cryptococcus depauperatus CBS 7841]|uniref:Uncharacterized protein n=1 Tax=Cryptococcus depauperatus CBS 7841 TaxID=1295531 RepID=A0A1E3II55_9TREE|nr:anaphase-promoting complex subunit 3 [Cryptococcus depauperatus CBS 7841]